MFWIARRVEGAGRPLVEPLTRIGESTVQRADGARACINSLSCVR
jgi:hypothetical protein